MKRIIVCNDGTWDRPGTTDGNTPVRSNVELIFNCIKSGQTEDKSIKQVKFYETGIGSSTFDKIDQILGGIEGFHIDKKIKDSYSFILLNYDI